MGEKAAQVEIEAGRLAWPAIRDLVREARFKGRNVEMFESSGWLSRRFVIRGDTAIVWAIAQTFKEKEHG